MHIFYTPDISFTQTSYILSEEESKHCVRVLRLSTGDDVVLVDGVGGWYDAKIQDAHPKKAILQILNYRLQQRNGNYYLHIAIAPPKNIERFEWFLEKATELGVHEITPLLCERSERKEIRVDRLLKVITSAMKQSLRAYHPKLNSMTTLRSLLQTSFIGQTFIAHCADGERYFLNQLIELQSQYLILIGPEGDFSENELKEAFQIGCKPISLGFNRLRTETAGLEACMEVNLLNRITENSEK